MPFSNMVSFCLLMVDPPVAKFAPWRKFAPSESRYALKYGSPKCSAATKSNLLHKETN